jgi:NADH-quinone oxidoreductase subunit G
MATDSTANPTTAAEAGSLTLATHRELLDDARLLDGEDALRACARKPVVRVNPATAESLDLTDGDRVTLGGYGFDLVVDPTVADGVVWAPAKARDRNLAAAGLAAGQPVALTKEVAP